MAPNTSTRGHTRKIFKNHSQLNGRAHIFSNRVVNSWNSLSEHVAIAPSLNRLKRRLNTFLHNHPQKFNPSSYIPDQLPGEPTRMCHSRLFSLPEVSTTDNTNNACSLERNINGRHRPSQNHWLQATSCIKRRTENYNYEYQKI